MKEIGVRLDANCVVGFLPKTDNMPHVLLLDGHSSHIYNLAFLDLMKAKNVHPFIFPAHTTHWLQPADKSFFTSLKQCWTNEGLKAVNDMAGIRIDWGNMSTPKK